MKVSVSLPEVDVQWLDAQVADHGHGSRSAVVQMAIDALRHVSLQQDYADAWQEWYESGEAELWECTVGDGID
ncbi:MAG: ribbon-helix-helix domain-containing protein [Jatrophihabitans sp.]